MINIDSKRNTNFAVTLTPCNFKENTYIARVPRKTITTDQILDLIAAHNQGIDRYQIGHAMELLKKEILVYINAVTCEEEDILVLLKSDGGTLAK